MKYKKITYQFIDKIPESLEEGKLYISTRFATAIHKCFCGCGYEVVTPLSPIDWKLIYDGDTVSLTPSIGNWGFPCMSHYWIQNSEVELARNWSKKEIDYARKVEQKEKEEYFKKALKPYMNVLNKWFRK